MNKESQRKWVLERLRVDGFVTRNQCLHRYITRLGAIIYRLKKEGFEIIGETLKTKNGTDYIYHLSKAGEKV